jgi:hypothetical protein
MMRGATISENLLKTRHMIGSVISLLCFLNENLWLMRDQDEMDGTSKQMNRASVARYVPWL